MTQTTTFRAAYLPSDGGGTLLPLPEHAQGRWTDIPGPWVWEDGGERCCDAHKT